MMKWWPVKCQKQVVKFKPTKIVGGQSFVIVGLYKNDHNPRMEEATNSMHLSCSFV